MEKMGDGQQSQSSRQCKDAAMKVYFLSRNLYMLHFTLRHLKSPWVITKNKTW